MTELIEEGRRLASQRDDLIAAGVDPKHLAIPVAPESGIDWDSPTWGQLGSNVHEAAWAPDPLHADETGDQ